MIRLLGLIFVLTTMVLAGWPVVAGEVVLVDGVRHVRNGAEPAEGVQARQLEELWRAGGADDEEVLFGLVTRVESDAAGNLYVFDAQLRQVLVFSPRGELTATLFREGEGPGEVRMPRDLVRLEDGRVGLAEYVGGKIVLVRPSGEAAGDLTATHSAGRLTVTSAAYGNGALLLSGSVHGPPREQGVHDRLSFLSRFDAAGQEEVCYASKQVTVDYQRNYVFREREGFAPLLWIFDVGPDGRVYLLPEPDAYAILVFAVDGTLDRVIERDLAVRSRTPAERARMQAIADRRFASFPFDLTVEIEETEPVINWMHRGLTVTGDGLLWVRHSESGRNASAGVLVTFDLFDAEGHFVRQIALRGEGDGTRDGFFPLGDDRWVRVTGFVDAMRSVYGGGRGPLGDQEEEPEPVTVIVYQLP